MSLSLTRRVLAATASAVATADSWRRSWLLSTTSSFQAKKPLARTSARGASRRGGGRRDCGRGGARARRRRHPRPRGQRLEAEDRHPRQRVHAVVSSIRFTVVVALLFAIGVPGLLEHQRRRTRQLVEGAELSGSTGAPRVRRTSPVRPRRNPPGRRWRPPGSLSQASTWAIAVTVLLTGVATAGQLSPAVADARHRLRPRPAAHTDRRHEGQLRNVDVGRCRCACRRSGPWPPVDVVEVLNPRGSAVTLEALRGREAIHEKCPKKKLPVTVDFPAIRSSSDARPAVDGAVSTRTGGRKVPGLLRLGSTPRQPPACACQVIQGPWSRGWFRDAGVWVIWMRMAAKKSNAQMSACHWRTASRRCSCCRLATSSADGTALRPLAPAARCRASPSSYHKLAGAAPVPETHTTLLPEIRGSTTRQRAQRLRAGRVEMR